MRTTYPKVAEMTKKWLIVDATEQTLGRLATEIARVLRGKNKAHFTPHLDCGDNVIVINAAKVKVTGKKETDKHYYHHTGYVGGIKSTNIAELREKHPDRIIFSAVSGMLPKNKLSRKLLTNLRIYADDKHPHAAQMPEAMSDRVKKL